MSRTRSHPSKSAPTVSKPLVGNQARRMENTTIIIRPSQNPGVA